MRACVLRGVFYQPRTGSRGLRTAVFHNSFAFLVFAKIKTQEFGRAF